MSNTEVTKPESESGSEKKVIVLPNGMTYEEPIKTEKVSKGVWVAHVTAWLQSNPSLRMEVDQFGKTEENARKRLEYFLKQ